MYPVSFPCGLLQDINYLSFLSGTYQWCTTPVDIIFANDEMIIELFRQLTSITITLPMAKVEFLKEFFLPSYFNSFEI